MTLETDQVESDDKVEQFFEVQKFWCSECREWHEVSVLGGPIGDPHEQRTNG